MATSGQWIVLIGTILIILGDVTGRSTRVPLVEVDQILDSLEVPSEPQSLNNDIHNAQRQKRNFLSGNFENPLGITTRRATVGTTLRTTTRAIRESRTSTTLDTRLPETFTDSTSPGLPSTIPNHFVSNDENPLESASTTHATIPPQRLNQNHFHGNEETPLATTTQRLNPNHFERNDENPLETATNTTDSTTQRLNLNHIRSNDENPLGTTSNSTSQGTPGHAGVPTRCTPGRHMESPNHLELQANLTSATDGFIMQNNESTIHSSCVHRTARMTDVIEMGFPSTGGVPYSYRTGQCPREMLGLASGDITHRGLCPWTYKWNYDRKRYPSTLMHAQCECPDCIEGDHFSVTNVCTPVYMKVKVFYRHSNCTEDGQGSHWDEPAYENVPVACVCSRPIEV